MLADEAGVAVAIDVFDGTELWRSDPVGTDAFGPTLVHDMVLMASRTGEAFFFDLETGVLIRKYALNRAIGAGIATDVANRAFLADQRGNLVRILV